MRIRLLLVFSGISFIAASQVTFSGISSFFGGDSILQARIKANGVRSVTETIREDSAIRFNGCYYFGRDARVTELITVHGTGFNRMKFQYAAGGMVTRQTIFDIQDTSKVDYWKARTLDAKNRFVKEERGRMQDGKVVVTKEYELDYGTEKKSRSPVIARRYRDNKLESTTIMRDSISARDTFGVSYEFRSESVDEKGRRFGSKTLSDSYVKDRCTYQHRIIYNVFGRSETAREIRTTYTQLDEKGRMTEEGEVNYEEAYMDFMQEHPENYNPSIISPLFIKALLAGKIQGEKRPETRLTYNEKGLVTEMTVSDVQREYQYTYRLKYNEKDQVVEQVTFEGEEESGRQLLWYNDKGLITRMQQSYRDMQSDPPAQKITEYNYTYTFY